jgi:pimeloyl-ACP methyl ester carboxylesterase
MVSHTPGPVRKPEVKNEDQTDQFSTDWFGLYYAQEYSWVSYASSQGYPTLTIDRLGSGESSHPDPILDVQTPLQVEILHQLVIQARSGTLPIRAAGKSLDRIIVAGHSYGSSITNAFNYKYPADADATILTGFGPHISQALIGFLIKSGVEPAALEDNRYAGYPAGYLEISSEPYPEFFFYYPGQYNQSIADLDFNTRGTITLGEAATAFAGTLTCTEYNGPVLVSIVSSLFMFL